MDIITVDDLTTYLAGNTTLTSMQLAQKADLANGVVSEAYVNSVDIAPVWVFALTLEVAARACRPSSGGLTRLTRAVDDASRTEQYSETASRGGVFLTPEERTLLAGKASIGSIRIGAPTYLGVDPRCAPANLPAYLPDFVPDGPFYGDDGSGY